MERQQLIPQESIVVVGLSGGPDSVFLLHFLAHYQKQASFTLKAAHLNHEWRNDANNDELLCKRLCQDLQIPFISTTMTALAFPGKYNGSKESYARHARRYFFDQVITHNKNTRIALAHHAQDQQETFFIRLLRGTSLSGLTAMKPLEGQYIRPLLHTSKLHILEYLGAHNIAYISDETNNSNVFLRNKIRNSVIPSLRAADQRFDSNFHACLTRLQETESYLQQHTADIFKTITRREHEILLVSIDALLSLHSVLYYRIIMHWLCQEKAPFVPTQSFFDEIRHFLQQPPHNKTHHIHAKWSLHKQNGYARIVLLHPNDNRIPNIKKLI